MDISITRDGACASDSYLPWDTVWNDDLQCGDWALSDPALARNRGGLAAHDGIATSVIVLLFTDRACPPDHPLAKYADGDLRGYWGDGVSDEPLGSLLWLLERNVVNDANARWAETFALDALAPLIRAGAAVRATAKAVAFPARNLMTLAVGLIGRDGTQIYNRIFEIVWRQRGF